jgi:hypothetical protein
MAAVHRLSGGLPREINVFAGYAMLTCFLENRHQVSAKHVSSVVTDYAYKGVTEPPRAEITESVEEASPATEEKPIASQPEEGEAEQSSVMFEKVSATDFDSTHKQSSSKTVMVIIGLMAVLVTFSAWMRSMVYLGTLMAALAQERYPPSIRDLLRQARSHRQRTRHSLLRLKSREPLRPTEGDALPVIILDRKLADELDQPVTIQIASLRYSEQADRSLTRLSEQTDIPGAVEIVTSEETTWYLILLGYYHNVEEAKAALLPILPFLRSQSVTEVRIKPSPAWLRTRLSEPRCS